MSLAERYARAGTFVVEEARVREMLAKWWQWCELENAALENTCEHYSLTALAASTCEIAEAIDTNFAGKMLDMLAEDPAEIEEVYRRRGPEALAKWRKYAADRPTLTEAEANALGRYIKAQFRDREGWKDVGSNVQIIQDRECAYSGGDAEAFASDYVRRLPPGWAESVVISLRPGEHPVVCRWLPYRLPLYVTQKWAEGLEQRFVALRSYTFGTDTRVAFPAVGAGTGAVTLEQLAAPPPAATVGMQVLPTGLEPLDAVLETGGVPTGARVTAYGETANAKTTALLEMAESLGARGLRVVWVATGDEPRESIQARRRQRRGMSRVEALTSSDEQELGSIHVVDGRKVTLDDVLAAPGRIDALFLDPLTKVRTRGGSSDQVVHVGEVLDLVEASGVTTFMTAPVVRGAGRRAKTERALGGARIEAGATLLLELTRTGDDLTIHVVKSRLGGEGLEVALRLDRERQRVLPAVAVPGAAPAPARSVEERIWADVQRLLAASPRSARELTEAVTGKAVTVRAVVRAKLDTGALLNSDGKVRLP